MVAEVVVVATESPAKGTGNAPIPIVATQILLGETSAIGATRVNRMVVLAATVMTDMAVVVVAIVMGAEIDVVAVVSEVVTEAAEVVLVVAEAAEVLEADVEVEGMIHYSTCSVHCNNLLHTGWPTV